MGNSTPFKIVPPKISFWNFAYLIMSGRLPAIQTLVSIGIVEAPLQIGKILPLCDFFDCPVLSLPFFLDPTPRSNRWTDFHALWLKRRVSAQGWYFWKLERWMTISWVCPKNLIKWAWIDNCPNDKIWKSQYLQNYKQDQDQVWQPSWDQQYHFVGGLTLPRSNPIWLPAAILKNGYDIITRPPIDRLLRNFADSCKMTCRWQHIRQNRNRKYNSNMAAVRFPKPEVVLSQRWLRYIIFTLARRFPPF